MFVVTVIFQVKDGQVEAFHEAVLQQAKNSLEKEEGCRRFDVCYDDARPHRVFLYELYDDATAFDRHRETEHFKNFRDISAPMLESRQLETWLLQSPS
jgi:quinol monooxygenase YgiN